MCVILIKTHNDTWPTLKFLWVCYMHTLTKTKITRQIHVLFLFTRLLHKSMNLIILLQSFACCQFIWNFSFKQNLNLCPYMYMHICQRIRSSIVLGNIKMNLIMWRYKHVIHIKWMVIFYITIFIMMV